MVALRLMSWNVQNLFEPGSGGGPRTEAEFDAKIAALAAIINRFHPDVLALQEVGTAAAPVRLQSSLLPTLSHRLLGVPDVRGIRVALLSRRVLRDRVDVVRFPEKILPTQTGDDPPGSVGPPTMTSSADLLGEPGSVRGIATSRS